MTVKESPYADVGRTDGFAQRLEKVFPFAGIKKHGRWSTLSRLSGIHARSIKRYYDEGRPPKNQDTFGRIVDALVESIRVHSGLHVNTKTLAKYLKEGGRSPLPDEADVNITPEGVPGFAYRAEKALKYTGVRRHGRFTEVGRAIGMTGPGVSWLFDNDKPPTKADQFDRLLEFIIDGVFNYRGKRLKKEELVSYLLFDGKYPFSDLDRAPKFGFEKRLSRVGSYELGEIYAFIYDVAKNDMQIDMFKELPRGVLQLAFDRVLWEFVERNADIRNKDARDRVKRIIEKAQAGML